MTRAFSLVLAVVFVGSAALGRSAPAQVTTQQITVGGGNPQAPRDPSQQNQPPRPVPVGGATVSGVVTTQDGGRPIREARVLLVGTVTLPDGLIESLTASASGAGAGAPPMNGRASSIGASLRVSRSVITDNSGRFVFAKLPAGRYTINVNRNPYLSTNYGQKRQGGQGASVAVADNQEVKVTIPMLRGGVISGTIYNEDGEPASGVQVRGWRYTNVNGFKRLQSNGFAQTDDRGMYRMFNLQPGDYLVAATPNNNDALMMARMNADMSVIEQAIATGKVQPPAMPGLPSTVLVPPPASPQQQQMQMQDAMNSGFLAVYFPSTAARASATSVHIEAGEERSATDINLVYAEAGSIRGTVSGALKPNVAVQISLISEDPFAENGPSTRADQKGAFTFRAVPPGKYTILAQTVASPPMVMNGQMMQPQGPPKLDDSDRLWDRASVSVVGGASEVNLSLHPGRTISGSVVFEMAKPPVMSNARMSVTFGPVPGSNMVSFGPPPQAIVEPDGSFKLSGLTPGQYVLRMSGAGTLKSAMIGGQDTLDFPLNFEGDRDINDAVITVTDKISELNGALTEGAGKPVPDYTVIAVSADQRFWTPGSRRISLTRTGYDGHYSFRALPPGQYLIAVFEDFESGLQYDPEFLKTLLSAGTRVSITEGAKVSQDLRVSR